MATAGQVTSAIGEVQAIGDTILKTLEGLDPGLAIPAGVAETVVDLGAQLATAGINAFSAASGTPITAESVLQLLPDQDPLPPPNS